MKAKRKGPRFTVGAENPMGIEIQDSQTPGMYMEGAQVVRLLNAGERARQQVKRLKAELARTSQLLADELAGKNDSWRRK